MTTGSSKGIAHVGRGRGNPGRLTLRPEGEPAPTAPPGLGREGRALWKLAWAQAWVASSDRPSVVEACRLADDVARLRAVLADRSDDPRLWSRLNAHSALLHRSLGVLALTPVDRSRLAQAAPSEDPADRAARSREQVAALLAKRSS